MARDRGRLGLAPPSQAAALASAPGGHHAGPPAHGTAAAATPAAAGAWGPDHRGPEACGRWRYRHLQRAPSIDDDRGPFRTGALVRSTGGERAGAATPALGTGGRLARPN